MKRTFLLGLLTTLSVGCLCADEGKVLQIKTTDASQSVPLASVVSIAFDGEETMLVRTDQETLSFSIKDIEIITLADGVTALTRISDDLEGETIRLWDVNGRSQRLIPSVRQLREEISTLPAGIYVIEVNGQTSKILKQ